MTDVMTRIPLAGPWITQKEIDAVAEAAKGAWYDGAYRYQQRFERAFADYVGVPFAVALPSCTSAIHLALVALGIRAGDEVIVPEITWIASAAPIIYVGASPVFADVDPKSWCLSAESLEACVTSRTKAVIPVDLYGNLPDMDAIRNIARRHGLSVIEDAAEAIGAEYQGRKAGSLGDIGVFSFHGSKTLTTGEGGMLLTNRQDLYERVKVLQDHGRRPGDKTYRVEEVAYKYQMSGLQAALGLAQLERIEELLARKREVFGWYRRHLDGVNGITLNDEASGTKSSYWLVTALLDRSVRDIPKEHVIERMNARQIDCRAFFYPLSSLPAFAHAPDAPRARQRNHVSYALSPYGINLPSALSLTEDTVAYVCQALRDVLSDVRA